MVFAGLSLSPALSAAALSGLLRIWPATVELDDRFANLYGQLTPWPWWQSQPFNLCNTMGIPETEIRPVRIAAAEGELDVWEVAEKIKGWLAHFERTTLIDSNME